MGLQYGSGSSSGISTYVGSLGEIGVNTTTNTIHVFDGSTSGGTSLAKSSEIGVGIQSAGTVIGTGITTINFIGSGNTFSISGSTVDVSISGGSGGSTGAGGTWGIYNAGIATVKSVGINTSTIDNSDLTGIGNSFQGLYVSNGMLIVDNVLSGNHYIGTNFNGLMAGPVTITGSLTIDGNYVVV